MSHIPTTDDLNQQNGPFIHRCPHDAENPYAQISRDLIRNNEISIPCRWLLCYLLSFDKTWKISIPFIMKTQRISKNRMYRILNEAMDRGYVKREIGCENGLRRYYYLVSEWPKFKKCLPCSEKQDIGNISLKHNGLTKFKKCLPCPQNRDLVNEDAKKEQVYSSLQSEYKEKQFISTNPVHNSDHSPTKPPLKAASRVAKAPLSADASEIYEHFLTKIRERKPDFKEPKKANWIAELDKMLRIDKRDKTKTKAIISWLIKDDFWFGNVLSPQKLRFQFDQLEIKMQAFIEEQKKEPNKRLFYETRAKNFQACKHIQVLKYGIKDTRNGKDAGWELPERTFAQIFAYMVGGKVSGN